MVRVQLFDVNVIIRIDVLLFLFLFLFGFVVCFVMQMVFAPDILTHFNDGCWGGSSSSDRTKLDKNSTKNDRNSTKRKVVAFDLLAYEAEFGNVIWSLVGEFINNNEKGRFQECRKVSLSSVGCMPINSLESLPVRCRRDAVVSPLM